MNVTTTNVSDPHCLPPAATPRSVVEDLERDQPEPDRHEADEQGP